MSATVVDQYRNDGFTVLHNVVGLATIAALGAAFDQVLASTAGTPDCKLMGGTNPQIDRPSRLHEAFRANQAIEEARIRAAMLMGIPRAELSWDMLIYKAPGSIGESDWHQDHAYSEKGTVRAGAMPNHLSAVQIWIALDNVDAENGCMHFIPGQHLKPMLAHEHIPARRLLRIRNESVALDLSKVVSCPLRSGDATAHGPNTPHFTPGNRSKNRPRRAYILTFIPVGADHLSGD